jgi:hypothetical protein
MRRLHQDNVVLFLTVEGLYLQRDGFTDGIAEDREAL